MVKLEIQKEIGYIFTLVVQWIERETSENVIKQTDIKNEQKVKDLLNSNINFLKFGWVNEAAKIINCKSQKVNEFMIRYLPEFYEQKCFKRKRARIAPDYESGEA